jgi:hypothetical protein
MKREGLNCGPCGGRINKSRWEDFQIKLKILKEIRSSAPSMESHTSMESQGKVLNEI